MDKLPLADQDSPQPDNYSLNIQDSRHNFDNTCDLQNENDVVDGSAQTSRLDRVCKKLALNSEKSVQNRRDDDDFDDNDDGNLFNSVNVKRKSNTTSKRSIKDIISDYAMTVTEVIYLYFLSKLIRCK